MPLPRKRARNECVIQVENVSGKLAVANESGVAFDVDHESASGGFVTDGGHRIEVSGGVGSVARRTQASEQIRENRRALPIVILLENADDVAVVHLKALVARMALQLDR